MESLRAKFEEQLSCAICLEQFKDPKVLPCLHSYCHECIVKLDKTGDQIICPECRMTVECHNSMESLRSKFEEHLTCAICLEQFKDPKVLPCLHSYCHECIVKLDKTGDQITCPECRMTLEVGNPPDISFLPSNLFAKNLLATLSLASESESGGIVCENCDSADPAETRCGQCSRYLCSFCTNVHRRFRDTSNHNPKSIDELKASNSPVIAETVRCAKHKDEVIKLYCTTCQETICRDCTIVDHRQHDFSFVEDVAQEKKGELLKLLEEVKEKKIEVSAGLANVRKNEEGVNARNDKAIAEIIEYFERLAKLLENKNNGLVEKATVLKNSKLKQLHAQREQLEITLASCESNIEFTEQAFENGNNVQILNMKKYISESLESLKNKSEIQSCVDDYVEFVTELTGNQLQSCFVVCEKESFGNYKACFADQSKTWLEMGTKSEITINPGGKSKPKSKTINPVFTGVAVKDVTTSKNPNGSHNVSFVPLEVGELKFQVYMDGRPSPQCTLSRSVKAKLPLSYVVGECIFESGIHTWKITVNHANCFVTRGSNINFAVGVIDYDNNQTVYGVNGCIKKSSTVVVLLELDMSKKQLTITSSWGKRDSQVYEVTSRRVSPFYTIDCEQCDIKVTDIKVFLF